MSQITEMTIQNVKNISKAVLHPGKFNQIVGKNSQGKTAVIDAVMATFHGNMDTSIIKVGEEKAQVDINMDDGAEIKWWLKKREGMKPTTFISYVKDGMSPQKVRTFLNEMMGVEVFDPREILNPKTRDQAIMELIDVKITKKDLTESLQPLDVTVPDLNFDSNALTVIDSAHDHFYAIRTERNKETKNAKMRWMNAVADIPQKPELTMPKMDLPDLTQDKERLTAEFNALRGDVTNWESNRQTIDRDIRQRDDLKSERIKLQSELDRLLSQIESKSDEHDRLCDSIREHETKLGEKPDILAETERITNEGTAIAAEIQRHNTLGSIQREENAAQSLNTAFEAAKGKSDALDLAVTRMRTTFRQSVMSKADLPIKGLEYADGKFTLAGRSLDHLSGSEALIIGLQLTRKKNPQTNVICIDGGECLDEETYANLQKAVADDGFNYFLTKVGGAFQSETDTVIEMKNGEPVQ